MQTDKRDKAYGLVQMHKNCRTWADRQKDFKFFTPGLLYWNLDVDRDLVEDFIAETPMPNSLRPKKFVADFDIFTITPAESLIHTPKGDMKFNIARTVYICPLEMWPKLDDFLGSCGFVNSKTKLFSRSMPQNDLLIPDFGAIKHGLPQTEQIRVAAYALCTNQFYSVWRQTISTVYSPPKACLLEPGDVTIKDGKLFFEEKDN